MTMLTIQHLHIRGQVYTEKIPFIPVCSYQWRFFCRRDSLRQNQFQVHPTCVSRQKDVDAANSVGE